MTTWSVSEGGSVFGSSWQLVTTSNGLSTAVAMFTGPTAEVLAKRCRDLLIRNGTEDVPLPADLEGTT